MSPAIRLARGKLPAQGVAFGLRDEVAQIGGGVAAECLIEVEEARPLRPDENLFGRKVAVHRAVHGGGRGQLRRKQAGHTVGSTGQMGAEAAEAFGQGHQIGRLSRTGLADQPECRRGD